MSASAADRDHDPARADRAGRGGLVAALREVAGPDGAFLLAARLTLFLLLLHSGVGWYFYVPMTVLALIGVLWSRALSDPLYWVSVSVFLVYGNILNWDINQNHDYLINYWCLALACCLAAGSPDSIRGVARVLIGLTMLLAVIWKSLTPDYLDGTFFQVLLLEEPRFDSAARFFTGIDGETLATNRALWMALEAPGSTLSAVPVAGADQVLGLARALSWWGFAVEVAMAVLFLVRGSRRAHFWGHVLLLVFIATTYVIANVVGFAWVLCVLGLAATEKKATATRVVYLVLFFVVFLFEIPISGHFDAVHDTAMPFWN